MSEELENGFKIGMEIKEIEEKIKNLPLEELYKNINWWETTTPFTDPTLFMQESKKMEQLKKKVAILLQVKREFLKRVDE